MPSTVTNQIVAAVVTPSTMSPRRRIAPAPMNPMPVRIPKGRRSGPLAPQVAHNPLLSNRS